MIHVASNGVGSIRSELVNYPSRSGRMMVAYIDHPPVALESPKFVVMSPKYGETKKNNLHLAYHLAAAGLSVLRFDHTCHPGESAGAIADYTFPGAVEDILSSIDFLEKNYGAGEAAVVASSLSVRPAVRAAALDARISLLVSVVGVVNFRATVESVYRTDLVGDHIARRPSGLTDILGHQVHVSNFMESCIAEGMHTLEGTLEDFSKARAQAILFFGENDVWVDTADVRRIEQEVDAVSIQVIDGAMHEVRENPKVAEEIMRRVAFTCLQGRLAVGEEWKVAPAPDRSVLFGQNRIERERLRKIDPIGCTESDFWKNYLGKYEILEKVGGYRDYLDAVGGFLGKLRPSEVLFDCGCGNGLFGVWTLRDLMTRRERVEGDDEGPPAVYVGLDLTEKGLTDALHKHFGAAAALRPPGDVSRGPTQFLYSTFDLDSLAGGAARLPYKEATFDKICCSLLISYLVDPASLMRELYRVLRPGCPVVVSSMKPFCDLSVIYRDFLDGEGESEDLDSARNLMSAAGAIKLKEEHGKYVFFEKEELEDLAREAGFRKIRPARSFGDQVNLVAAIK